MGSPSGSNLFVQRPGETGKTVMNMADSHGRSSLHVACVSGRRESVCYLLKPVVPSHVQGMQSSTHHSMLCTITENTLGGGGGVA